MRALLAGLVLLLAASARAGELNPAILSVDNGVSLGYSALHLYYIEPSGVDQLANVPGSGYEDYEKGTIEGAKLGAGVVLPQAGNLYLRAGLQHVEGDVTYTGFTQQTFKPIYGAISHAIINEWDVRAGKSIATGERWALTPYGAFGGRHWVRELGPMTTGDFVESYNHYFLGAGALTQFALQPAWVWTLDASLAKMISPTINVPGQLDHTALGPSPIIKVGLESDTRLSSAAHLFAAVDYEYFTYGQSANQIAPPNIVMEPFSRTETWSFTVGARVSFR